MRLVLLVLIVIFALAGCEAAKVDCDMVKSAFDRQDSEFIQELITSNQIASLDVCDMPSPLLYSSKWKDRILTDQILAHQLSVYDDILGSFGSNSSRMIIWNFISNAWFDLVPEGFDYSYKDYRDRDNALLWACYDWSIEGIKHLLQNNVAINSLNMHGENCGHEIARSALTKSGAPPSFSYLVSEGLEINQFDDLGITPLYKLILEVTRGSQSRLERENLILLLKDMLNNGAKPDAKSEHDSALGMVSQLDDQELITLLNKYK